MARVHILNYFQLSKNSPMNDIWSGYKYYLYLV